MDFLGVENPTGFKLGGETIGGIITTLLPSIFALAGMVALLVLIWGGIRYMTARGRSKNSRLRSQYYYWGYNWFADCVTLSRDIFHFWLSSQI